MASKRHETQAQLLYLNTHSNRGVDPGVSKDIGYKPNSRRSVVAQQIGMSLFDMQPPELQFEAHALRTGQEMHTPPLDYKFDDPGEHDVATIHPDEPHERDGEQYKIAA